MSGGETSVFRCETGEDSSMPAWKREILERRKARSGGVAESYSSTVTTRFNGELNGDTVSSPMPNRNYRITSASRYFSGNHIFTPASPQLSPFKTKKDTCATSYRCDLTALEKDVCSRTRQESSVLRDSLGPLQENPFIKMEKERKKRQEQEDVSRSVQHILELYSNVPGIRTIRAENIIIIESDPDYFPEPQDLKTGSRLHQNGSYSSLNDLLDLKGTAVTEIHAKEVVIYDSPMKKTKERLRTLGRRGSDGELEMLEGRGRVSRMLQKFDCTYDKLQPKSRSNENLLDLDASPVGQRAQPKVQPEPVPKFVTLPKSNLAAVSPEFKQSPPQISQSKSQTLPSNGEQQSSTPCTIPPKSVPSSFQLFKVEGECSAPAASHKEPERSQAIPQRKRDQDVLDAFHKFKVPSSPERARVCAESPTSVPSLRPSSTSKNFEIRPAPLPDLSALPADNIQARALANLRLQSRNSFTVIPKGRMPSSNCAMPISPARAPPSSCLPLQPETQAATVSTSTAPATPLLNLSSLKTQEGGAVVRQAEEVARPKPDPPAAPEASLSASVEPIPNLPVQVPEAPPADRLPVTNIDDVVVEHPHAATSAVVLGRKGNTFKVVPKRRPGPHPGSPEPPDPAGDQEHVIQPPKPAPYAHLGSLLKKRYPRAEEIEVIGGYLSLSRSCLSKSGSTRKKLKISFNESSLHSTFEYPSESSLWDSGEGENEEEEGEKGDTVTERFLIPRPSYVTSPTFTANTIDLSSYTPKHSVDFSAWQEHKHENHGIPVDSNTDSAEVSLQEEMLTPADSSSHSGFISDPSLYF
ncbi:hypothetical protein MATL_G00062780 [Megalops atlanticus]|uniref:Taperin n=1 Tax=Megalops atlanticus TaxID=7932 RepID=A0A9D3Q8J2_MEGAT|nr:hypothetical protein MATL_G00062780 [Megalops atlanticus]